MKFRRNYDSKKKAFKGEPGGGISMTQPDMHIPLKKLLENHTRTGIPIVQKLEGQYLNTEIPKIDDLNDLIELRESIEEQKKQVQSEIDEQILVEKAKAAKKRKAKALETVKDKTTEKGSTQEDPVLDLND